MHFVGCFAMQVEHKDKIPFNIVMLDTFFFLCTFLMATQNVSGGLNMKKTVMTLFALLSLMGISSFAIAQEQNLWGKTMKDADSVVAWSVETSKKGWQATKERASGVVEWTADKTQQGWKVTKEGTVDIAEWTLQTSKKAWNASAEAVTKGASSQG